MLPVVPTGDMDKEQKQVGSLHQNRTISFGCDGVNTFCQDSPGRARLSSACITSPSAAAATVRAA